MDRQSGPSRHVKPSAQSGAPSGITGTPSGIPGTPSGILGQSWRASITQWGDVHLLDGSEPVSWAIAAEDRWHFPEHESSTRQSRVSGTPVTETRVRVPNGDVVQRIWSASLRDEVSAVLVEFTNDSPLPVAISLSRSDVVTPRSYHRLDSAQRPWPSEDRGIERPPLVIPLGHRSSMRVALARTGNVAEDDVDSFPDWEAVVRGWVSVTDGASRFEVPDLVDGVPVEDLIRIQRSNAALANPEAMRGSIDDEIRWLVAHRELVRMGLASVDVPEIVTVLERLLRIVRKQRNLRPEVADALRTGALLLADSDSRAYRDLQSASSRTLFKCGHAERKDLDFVRSLGTVRRVPLDDIVRRRSVSRDLIAAVECDFASWSAHDEAILFPDGFVDSRLGVNAEAHHVPAGAGRTISLAIRWHGERPAVIWEVDGPPGLLLRSGVDPHWTSVESRGEALWSAPTNSAFSG
jgi:hypothetical protein